MNKMSDSELLNKVAQAIFDKKGENILVLDVRGISSMTDYFVIAEGNVDRHVKALSLYLKGELQALGVNPFCVEGEREGDWVVMDYGDFVVHIFIPELREKYSLEEVWKNSKIVDVEIITGR